MGQNLQKEKEQLINVDLCWCFFSPSIFISTNQFMLLIIQSLLRIQFHSNHVTNVISSITLKGLGCLFITQVFNFSSSPTLLIPNPFGFCASLSTAVPKFLFTSHVTGFFIFPFSHLLCSLPLFLLEALTHLHCHETWHNWWQNALFVSSFTLGQWVNSSLAPH